VWRIAWRRALSERGEMSAHPHPGFWLSAFFLDFAFTATSFFAGAEKRK
jgi:hypothetical protein